MTWPFYWKWRDAFRTFDWNGFKTNLLSMTKIPIIKGNHELEPTAYAYHYPAL